MERYQAVRSPEIVLPAPGPIARHFRGRAPNVAATSAVLLKAGPRARPRDGGGQEDLVRTLRGGRRREAMAGGRVGVGGVAHEAMFGQGDQDRPKPRHLKREVVGHR